MKLQEAIDKVKFPTKEDFDKLFNEGKREDEVYTISEIVEKFGIKDSMSGYLIRKIKTIIEEECYTKLSNRRWVVGHKDLIRKVKGL